MDLAIPLAKHTHKPNYYSLVLLQLWYLGHVHVQLFKIICSQVVHVSDQAPTIHGVSSLLVQQSSREFHWLFHLLPLLYSLQNFGLCAGQATNFPRRCHKPWHPHTSFLLPNTTHTYCTVMYTKLGWPLSPTLGAMWVCFWITVASSQAATATMQNPTQLIGQTRPGIHVGVK